MADFRSSSLVEPSAQLTDSQATDCRFGICFRPSWAKPFASPKLFLIVFSLLNIIQGMMFLYFVAVMTTIEQYFQMKSEVMAFVLSFGELIPMIVGLVLSFFLGDADRPRWTGFGTMLISVGCFIMSLPYFVWRVAHPEDRFGIGSYDRHNLTTNLCIPADESNYTTSWTDSKWKSSNDWNSIQNFSTITQAKNSSIDCNLATTQENNAAVIFVYLMGYMLLNTGAVLLYVVATPYLDDNVRQKNSPLYMAVTCSFRTIGPMLGFVLAYFCLSVYVNPNEIIPFDQTDRRWLGAWWLGYIILAIVAALGAFLVMQFPQRLPSRHWTPAIELVTKASAEKSPMMSSDSCKNQEGKMCFSLKQLIPVVRRLFTNFLLLSRILSSVFTWSAIQGYSLYLPKYFEHQFNVQASSASIWTGVSIIVPIIVGDILVGIYLQRARPSARRLALFLVISKCVCALAYPILMTFFCDSSYIVGLDKTVNLQSCDANCECPSLPYSPVCANNGMNFLSACHAGCSTINNSSAGTVYSDCVCLDGGDVIKNLCDGICPKLLMYVALTALSNIVLGFEVVGGVIFMFRCVEAKDKTVAVGLSTLFLGFLAFFPTPILFATIVDATCSLWSSSCGQKGACLRYDMDRFRFLLHGVPFGLLLVSIFWDILFFKKAHKIRLFVEEDEEEE